MRRLLLASVVAAGVLFAALPSVAQTAQPVPAYCGSNPKFLAKMPEGATLVEQKLYFHGTTPSGDADVRRNVDDLFMDATAPTSPTPKMKLNKGAVANAAANKNSLATYFVADLAEPQRIVCAEVTFHAGGTEPFSTSLFVDQPRGTATAATSGSASTSTSENVNRFSGNFGRSLDVTANEEIVVQMLAATASPVLYDSTTYNGALTYLTVVAP